MNRSPELESSRRLGDDIRGLLQSLGGLLLTLAGNHLDHQHHERKGDENENPARKSWWSSRWSTLALASLVDSASAAIALCICWGSRTSWSSRSWLSWSCSCFEDEAERGSDGDQDQIQDFFPPWSPPGHNYHEHIIIMIMIIMIWWKDDYNHDLDLHPVNMDSPRVSGSFQALLFLIIIGIKW